MKSSTTMLSEILALCIGSLLADPSCNISGLTPELRQKILDFHSGKGKSLQWDCGMEQKAHDAISGDGVDVSSIGDFINEYAQRPTEMTTDVEEALDFWWNKDPRNGHANMENAKEKIGCTYRKEVPLFFFVCAYVGSLT
ncbi:hypothetical protein Aduo_003292 [Ancylostoma duodenale]